MGIFHVRRILFYLAIVSITQCSLSGNGAPGERTGVIVGMFEIQVVTWGDAFSGLHKNGITLYLKNTLTGLEKTADVTNGFYYFDNLPKGNYRIYRAVMQKSPLNLEIELSQFTVVVDSYISVMQRVRHYKGIRLRSFNEKGINDKSVRMNYPMNQPHQFIKTTFQFRKEKTHLLLVF